MPTWPADLPCTLQIDSQLGGIGDGRIRSATDTGPGKMRRRSTAMSEPISGGMIMDREQIQILRDFVEDTLGGGILVFDFPNPEDHDEMIQVRIGEQMPNWSRMPGKKRWFVNLMLEKIP